MKRAIKLAAKLYPSAWRQRYGPEFDALLDQSPGGWREFQDVSGEAVVMNVSSKKELAWAVPGVLLSVWLFQNFGCGASVRLTEWALSLLGLGVIREGDRLLLATQQISATADCRGVWSLLALAAWSLLYAILFERRPRVRMTLLLGTVPIAILANSLRLTLLGWLGETANTEFARGIVPDWYFFPLAMLILFLVHRLLIKAESCRPPPNRVS